MRLTFLECLEYDGFPHMYRRDSYQWVNMVGPMTAGVAWIGAYLMDGVGRENEHVRSVGQMEYDRLYT